MTMTPGLRKESFQSKSDTDLRDISHFRLEPFVNVAANRIIGFEVLSSLNVDYPVESWFEKQQPADQVNILKFQVEQIAKFKTLNLIEKCFFNLTIAGFLRLNTDDIRFLAEHKNTGLEISDAFNIRRLNSEERKAFFCRIDFLRKAGVTVWVDDFYFDELIHLNYYVGHVDGIKMDRSEVRTPWLRKEISLIRRVLGDIDILVEGVETESDLTAVRKAGVHFAQGYFWSVENLTIDVSVN